MDFKEQKMILKFYFIVVTLFALGGVLFFFSQKNKASSIRKEGGVKFLGYFVIVNGVLLSMIIQSKFFFFLAIGIVLVGLFEIIIAIAKKKNLKKGIPILFIYILLAYFFIQFSKLEQSILLFTFLIISNFDAFSQVFGQWFGKNKISPKVSPNKTWEGFMGGLIGAIVIAPFLQYFIQIPPFKMVVFAFLFSLFAFLGDLLESFSKRQLQIKDYSNLLPGQGGFLDRFDSFIFSGALIYLLKYFHFI